MSNTQITLFSVLYFATNPLILFAGPTYTSAFNLMEFAILEYRLLLVHKVLFTWWVQEDKQIYMHAYQNTDTLENKILVNQVRAWFNKMAVIGGDFAQRSIPMSSVSL